MKKISVIKKERRKGRIRKKVFGTAKRPRFSVFRSLRDINVQVIDDVVGKTLAFSGLKDLKNKSGLEGAREVGKAVAKKCLAQNIKSVIFDRNGYKYHGKVKSVADGAREGGLIF